MFRLKKDEKTKEWKIYKSDIVDYFWDKKSGDLYKCSWDADTFARISIEKISNWKYIKKQYPRMRKKDVIPTLRHEEAEMWQNAILNQLEQIRDLGNIPDGVIPKISLGSK